MRIVRVGPSRARSVGAFGSSGVDVGVLARLGESRITSVAVATFEPGGVLGRHPTALWQLFTVIGGSGWVSGSDDVPRELGVGSAALWAPDEQHASGSVSGMTVCIVESDVDPTVALDLADDDGPAR